MPASVAEPAGIVLKFSTTAGCNAPTHTVAHTATTASAPTTHSRDSPSARFSGHAAHASAQAIATLATTNSGFALAAAAAPITD